MANIKPVFYKYSSGDCVRF